MQQVSLNPLAKHARAAAGPGDEELETRQLETALDKICGCTPPLQTPPKPPPHFLPTRLAPGA